MSPDPYAAITKYQQAVMSKIERQVMAPYQGTSSFVNPSGNTMSVTWNINSTSTSTATSDWPPYKPGAAYQLSDLVNAWYDGAGSTAHHNNELQNSNDYKLPDGAILRIDEKGNYQIDESDARVKYLSNNIRDFSPHLNASDMVAAFVEYAGTCGVHRDEVLQLPIDLFIRWLIIEAAERDSDPIPEGIQPVAGDLLVVKKPKCLTCGRYIRRLNYRNGFRYCDPIHAARHVKKIESRQLA